MLSVIIPFHNAKKFIKNCFKYIERQTVRTNVEFIFINDGSNDNCVDIFKEYLDGIPNIRLINIKKSGVSKARNVGIAHANGDYITFLDIDDEISSNFVETLIENIDKYQKDVYLYNYFEKIGNNTRYIKHIESDNNLKDISRRNIVGLILGVNCEYPFFASVWRLCIKKSFITNNNIQFKEDIYIAEDMLFYLNCLTKTESFFYVDKAVYTYIRRAGSSLNLYRTNFASMQFKLHEYFYSYLKIMLLDGDPLWNSYYVNKFRCYTVLISNECKSKEKIKFKILSIKKICEQFKTDELATSSYPYLEKSFKIIFKLILHKFCFLLLFLFSFKERVRLWKLKESN